MDPVYVALAFVLGLAIGSFLNVVIYRLPRKESLLHPGSHCPNCQAPVKTRDNIPVLGWLLLRGRCRSCGQPFSIRYPAVELLTAVLFALVVGTQDEAIRVVLGLLLVDRARADRADRPRRAPDPQRHHRARRRSPRSSPASRSTSTSSPSS